jgi:hypothetical protein
LTTNSSSTGPVSIGNGGSYLAANFNAGSGLTVGHNANTVTYSIKLGNGLKFDASGNITINAPTNCTSDQKLMWNGSSWYCMDELIAQADTGITCTPHLGSSSMSYAANWTYSTDQGADTDETFIRRYGNFAFMHLVARYTGTTPATDALMFTVQDSKCRPKLQFGDHLEFQTRYGTVLYYTDGRIVFRKPVQHAAATITDNNGDPLVFDGNVVAPVVVAGGFDTVRLDVMFLVNQLY